MDVAFSPENKSVTSVDSVSLFSGLLLDLAMFALRVLFLAPEFLFWGVVLLHEFLPRPFTIDFEHWIVTVLFPSSFLGKYENCDYEYIKMKNSFRVKIYLVMKSFFAIYFRSSRCRLAQTQRKDHQSLLVHRYPFA